MIYATRPLGKAGRPKISEQTKDNAVKMYNDGFSCSVIANELKISRASVYRIIKERQEVFYVK